ncbi:MAG TPA: hypothetical protein VFW50_43460 [Streptosporangiaceae bacterium]|nr:hypothetical protein [Streptosporangiaceae bacterium]
MDRKKEPVLLLDLSTSMNWGAADEYGPEWPDPGSRRAIVIEALYGLVRVLEREDSEAAAEQADGSDELGGLMTHGFADDWQEFEPVLERATAKRVFVVAVVGHGRKHDATSAAYQGAARKNQARDKFGKRHVEVVSFDAVTDPAEIALDLTTLVS